MTQSEHPAAAPQDGEAALEAVIEALLVNPDVWNRTVLFYMYDENGGFFDHVVPATPPAFTAGGDNGPPTKGLPNRPPRPPLPRPAPLHLPPPPRCLLA